MPKCLREPQLKRKEICCGAGGTDVETRSSSLILDCNRKNVKSWSLKTTASSPGSLSVSNLALFDHLLIRPKKSDNFCHKGDKNQGFGE